MSTSPRTRPAGGAGSPPFADLVTIGRVVKPQGRRGEVAVEPLSDRPDRFPALRRVFVPEGPLGSRPVAVTGCWPHKGRFVLKLEGVDSIEAAEAFRGVDLRIGEDELPPLPRGSYYHHQLRGLPARDEGGAELGRVEEVLETGAAPVLRIVGPRGETLVPLAEPFLLDVDLAGGRLLVRLPETGDAGD